MDKAKPAFCNKYDQVLKPAHYYGDNGWVVVAEHNLHHLSMLLHASAMKTMGIASEREEQLFLGNAYQGESGELGNVIKKIARDGMSPALMEKLKGEIADNYLYLMHICDLFGVSSEEAMLSKTSELYNKRQPPWAEEAIICAGGNYIRLGDEVSVR